MAALALTIFLNLYLLQTLCYEDCNTLMYAVEHVPVVLELHASVKGRPRRTGELSIMLDASVLRRAASLDGVLPYLSYKHALIYIHSEP